MQPTDTGHSEIDKYVLCPTLPNDPNLASMNFIHQ